MCPFCPAPAFPISPTPQFVAFLQNFEQNGNGFFAVTEQRWIKWTDMHQHLPLATSAAVRRSLSRAAVASFSRRESEAIFSFCLLFYAPTKRQQSRSSSSKGGAAEGRGRRQKKCPQKKSQEHKHLFAGDKIFWVHSIWQHTSTDKTDDPTADQRLLCRAQLTCLLKLALLVANFFIDSSSLSRCLAFILSCMTRC